MHGEFTEENLGRRVGPLMQTQIIDWYPSKEFSSFTVVL